ncbi:hypothetical protein NSQ62_08230 [Solibacillus sp. FSL H8-0523]|uniref:hypothetical protein n=1 Tax=Solibacillus sp. FSL H8-0523 TaxID=2954511 RepID=UPI00310198D0
MGFIYKVVTEGGINLFDSKAQLLAKYTQVDTVTRPSVRKELQGQPILEGLLGAMYDGMQNGKHVIRYESQKVYDMLSQ